METPRRSYTTNNRSLAVMEASRLEAPHCHVPLARGAVTNTSIASLDLQTFIDPLPLMIARRNVADISRYLDAHAAHLAACTGALDDSIPLMAAETYPRLPGGIRSALQDMQRD